MTNPSPGPSTLSSQAHNLLRMVLQCYPNLSVASVASVSGQFNDVLIVNDDVVFRFPRTADAAASIATERVVLEWLKDRLPIPIPYPTFSAMSDNRQRPLFVGYRRLSGRQLDRRTLDDVHASDRAGFERLGGQLGEFLRVLHGFSADQLGVTLPSADGVAHWTMMLDAFRDELFGFMRPDARAMVERDFLAFLTSPDSVGWQPVLRHGDFGGTNLLYDDESRRISGVIDFGGVALGDPAVDLAALTAFHDRLARALQPHYPELFTPATQRRATFYRSTFALQQALWAIRAGDDDEFNDGIAAYV